MKRIFTKRLLIPITFAAVLIGATGFKSDFFEIAKQIEIFTTLFKELNMNYVDETNPAELMETAIKQMLAELDPYTTYMSEQDVEGYRIRRSGEYSGIGALVSRYNGKMIITEPYKGYPADKAGLKAGDEIIKIGEIVVADFKEDVSDLLQGASGSMVEITYRRQGELLTTQLTRGEIEVDAVPFSSMIDDKTGYISLVRFNRKASKQTAEALEELKDLGAERMVLDLRGNPGGLLSEAVNVTNLFVPKDELVVYTKSKVKKFNREYFTRNEAVDTDISLVVLVNGRSASASEIVSGALQDLDRAVIVGARSFGKGLVQRPKELIYGTQLKVTISRYYTPSGRCIQALDYWNRDEGGNAIRIEEQDYNEFTTRNGRKVFDGGGVMPDMEVSSAKSSELTRSLIDERVVFDFATQYYYANPSEDLASFTLGDAEFEAFKEYVRKSDFTFEGELEKSLKKALSDEETSHLDKSMKGDIAKLLNEIEEREVDALNQYKEQILKDLSDEILKRYFYREGLFEYNLTHDPAVNLATAILADNKKYSEILR